jgi:hypothetical protein
MVLCCKLLGWTNQEGWGEYNTQHAWEGEKWIQNSGWINWRQVTTHENYRNWLWTGLNSPMVHSCEHSNEPSGSSSGYVFTSWETNNLPKRTLLHGIHLQLTLMNISKWDSCSYLTSISGQRLTINFQLCLVGTTTWKGFRNTIQPKSVY